MKKINLFTKFNLPEQIGTTIGLIGVVLIVSFLFPDKDFGIIKTPKFDNFNYFALIIGVILIGINFPFFKKEVVEVVIFKQSQEIQSEFKNIISGIKSEAVFWGGNFYISVNEHKSLLIEKLKNGKKIKYLIFNPYSTLCENASKDFDESNGNHFYDQCITTIKNLIDLESEWKKQKQNSYHAGGSLEIKLYSNIPRLRAYIIDPNEDNAFSYFIHFLYKTGSSDLTAYKIMNGKNGIVKSYMNSFYKLWEDNENTITLEEYQQHEKIK